MVLLNTICLGWSVLSFRTWKRPVQTTVAFKVFVENCYSKRPVFLHKCTASFMALVL